MHGQPVAEHVPGNHHVGFHSIHGEPVHAKELGQEGVPVALHDELGKGREGQHCQTEPTPDRTQQGTSAVGTGQYHSLGLCKRI